MKTEKQAAYDHLMHVVCDGLNSSQRSDFVYWLPKLPIEQLAAAQKLAARDVDQCSLYLWNLIVSKKRKVAGGLEFPRAAVIPKLPKAKIRPPGLSARKKYSPRRPGPGDWSCNELNDFWYVINPQKSTILIQFEFPDDELARDGYRMIWSSEKVNSGSWFGGSTVLADAGCVIDVTLAGCRVDVVLNHPIDTTGEIHYFSL